MQQKFLEWLQDNVAKSRLLDAKIYTGKTRHLWQEMVKNKDVQLLAFVPLEIADIQLGTKREITKDVQRFLATQGFYRSSVDGVWGRGTSNAFYNYCRKTSDLVIAALAENSFDSQNPKYVSKQSGRTGLGYYTLPNTNSETWLTSRATLEMSIPMEETRSVAAKFTYGISARFFNLSELASRELVSCSHQTQTGKLNVVFERRSVKFATFQHPSMTQILFGN
jgi:hypothetical protein